MTYDLNGNMINEHSNPDSCDYWGVDGLPLDVVFGGIGEPLFTTERLFATSPACDWIYRINIGEREGAEIFSGAPMPLDLSINDGNGDFAFSSTGGVVLMQDCSPGTDCNAICLVDGMLDPTGVFFEDENNLLVVDRGTEDLYRITGDFASVFPTPEPPAEPFNLTPAGMIGAFQGGVTPPGEVPFQDASRDPILPSQSRSLFEFAYDGAVLSPGDTANFGVGILDFLGDEELEGATFEAYVYGVEADGTPTVDDWGAGVHGGSVVYLTGETSLSFDITDALHAVYLDNPDFVGVTIRLSGDEPITNFVGLLFGAEFEPALPKLTITPEEIPVTTTQVFCNTEIIE